MTMNFVPDGYFPEADQAWLPTYLDIKVRYPTFGFTALQVDDDLPTVASRMQMLDERFTERYANRMISSETLERWQVRLQNRFDEVSHRYERAYGLYSRYEQQMDDDVLPGEQYNEKETTSVEDTAGGSDSSENSSSTADTPDTASNASDDYADSRTKGSSKVTYGRTDKSAGTRELERTRTLTGQDLLLNVNNSIMSYMDIDTMFIAEFENLFLNVWWY